MKKHIIHKRTFISSILSLTSSLFSLALIVYFAYMLLDVKSSESQNNIGFVFAYLIIIVACVVLLPIFLLFFIKDVVFGFKLLSLSKKEYIYSSKTKNVMLIFFIISTIIVSTGAMIIIINGDIESFLQQLGVISFVLCYIGLNFVSLLLARKDMK